MNLGPKMQDTVHSYRAAAIPILIRQSRDAPVIISGIIGQINGHYGAIN
jgi:hypothetical protein